jgi:hypothetical protein
MQLRTLIHEVLHLDTQKKSTPIIRYRWHRKVFKIMSINRIKETVR